MSFVAAIDSSKNIGVWSRAVNALAQISDQIKFNITASTLTLSSVNPSRTGNGEVSFDRSYFREYTFDTQNISIAGFRIDENDHESSSYSCIVSSKHMVVLFKNLDAASLSYICLRLECYDGVPRNKEYKIFVEILTRKMIVKKYSVNYQPVLPQESSIPRIYKKDFDTGKCKHLMMESSTMKSFLDMVPLSTEDFKIDVKQTKISFVAHTRQVLKDRELLKQPMSITISMAISELLESNLEGVTDSINFRLKDFRTFISCCMSMRDLASTDDDLSPEPSFEAYFKTNGDPVVLEHFSGPVLVRLIILTAGTGELPKEDEHRDKYVLQGHTIQRAPESHIDKPSRNPQFATKGRLETTAQRHDQRAPSIEPESFNSFPTSSMGEIVTYGKRGSTPTNENPAKKAKTKPLDGDTDYSTSEEEGEEQEFGPTQQNNKPTSLFE
ncbi:hypothetical protein FT663_02756 [Candidozyma haemuli var. vulneris]|uniref:DNA repair protein rad9 n=1 Tax=Candidozyma haemuli TaxID=45357 RepID=A0A2V1ATD6_9ASCO|nr:hypothetical protein CXQ85_000325 [[Candida] haemuloni]KAF3989392.1 hypothetical protein FT662_02845 [[Candida] haemuloni var. vulneris]KAF3991349.1 hypothetical protein FT663_02756 [[Candida] haemuloni var. vulneris]PVH21350.1 hypothetical protein CXQ85_000325 [[Candida] haemuloni]